MGCGGSKGSGGGGGGGGGGGRGLFGPSNNPPLTCKKAELELEFHAQVERHGFFSSDVTAATVGGDDPLPTTIQREGAVAGSLLTIVPRIHLPSQEESMAMAAQMMSGGSAQITSKFPLDLYFAATAETLSQSVETVCMISPFTIGVQSETASLGYSTKTAIEFNTTPMGQALTPHMSSGFSLNGVYFNITGAGTSASAGVLSGSSANASAAGYLSYVLQRAPGQEQFPVELAQTSFTVKITSSMGKMTHELPDVASYLAQAGADGWRLCGTFMNPVPAAGPEMSAMGTTVKYDMPFEMLLERRPALPKRYRYTVVQHSLKIEIGTLGGMKLKGSLDPVIEQGCAAGWQLRGAVQLPMTVKQGMRPDISMPYLLMFMAEDFGDAAAASPEGAIETQ